MGDETLQKTMGARLVLWMQLEPGIDKGPEEPGPYGPLMVRRITRAQVAIILGLVIRMTWGK